MIRLHTVNIVVAVFVLLLYESGGKREKFKVILEDVRHCPHPNPPYMNTPTVIPNYIITSVNGKRYLNGNTTITQPTPFQNFSARTFSVDISGKRDVKMHIQGVSCHNIFARSILLYSNIGFTKRSCMLRKGFSHYELDLDRVMHGMPSWHAAGVVLHQLQMATAVGTYYCEEILVKVSNYK